MSTGDVIDVVQDFMIVVLFAASFFLTRRVRALEGDARHYGGGRK